MFLRTSQQLYFVFVLFCFSLAVDLRVAFLVIFRLHYLYFLDSDTKFSIIIRSLFDSYNNMVSTASMEELCRTTLAWLDQHCSLVSLRPSEQFSLNDFVASFFYSRFGAVIDQLLISIHSYF